VSPWPLCWRGGATGSSPASRSARWRPPHGSPPTPRATATGSGFVGAADGTRAALQVGTALPFQLWLAAGVVAGGAALGQRRLRVPDRARAARAAAGGLLMGAGGSVAHGCNIGHGLTGVSLLSLGSLLATASMASGALLTWRLLLAPRPRLRGRDDIATRG
jgi:hypothetical protein